MIFSDFKFDRDPWIFRDTYKYPNIHGHLWISIQRHLKISLNFRERDEVGKGRRFDNWMELIRGVLITGRN